MTKTITLNHITKIEGHAKLTIGIEKNKVNRCELSSTEGSRYFEGLVLGRKYYEAHEMTSRICGICSCAHVITAISAIENALGCKPSKQTKTLRELLTLAERIRSHATHPHFLALPDYLGYESALAMASKYKPELERALHIMKVGNEMIKLLGSRDLHPVSATIGGWLKLPSQETINYIKENLIKLKEPAINTADLFFSLNYPSFASEGHFCSLKDRDKYAILDGTFFAAGIERAKEDYRSFIEEYSVPHSTANFVRIAGKRYTVGALSRINNNHKKLSINAKKMLEKSGIKFPSLNPFHNNIAQAIELVHCIDEAIKICEEIEIKPEPLINVKVAAGRGVGAIEVPRGTLWHEYTLDNKGIIRQANIITPTAQNLLNIQEDIKNYLPFILEKKKEDIIMDIEKLIRSYDPCFSCSSHFLEVNWI